MLASALRQTTHHKLLLSAKTSLSSPPTQLHVLFRALSVAAAQPLPLPVQLNEVKVFEPPTKPSWSEDELAQFKTRLRQLKEALENDQQQTRTMGENDPLDPWRTTPLKDRQPTMTSTLSKPSVEPTPVPRKMGRYSKEESEKVLELVLRIGYNWRLIHREFGGTRVKESLAQHFHRILRPAHIDLVTPVEDYAEWTLEEAQKQFFNDAQFGRRTGPFSRKEHEILMSLVGAYGTRWSVFALVFAGTRTYKQLCTHYKCQKAGARPYVHCYQKIELDIPEGMVTGDPSWKSSEIREMKNIVKRGLQINSFAHLFPKRTTEELNRMREWVVKDTYTGSSWSKEELDVLKQFVDKYGRKWMMLAASRCLPGRSPVMMQTAYRRAFKKGSKN